VDGGRPVVSAAARRATSRARRAAGVLCLALATLLPPPAAAQAARRPHVLLICLDTVRADRLGCYGYADRPTTPALDTLAASGTLFRDASSTAGWTKPSVPSFLTGTFPCQHGVYEGSARGLAGATTHVLPEAAGTLAEHFRAAGYDTGAIIHNAQLRRGGGFEQGFDDYDDQAGDARDLRARAMAWLDRRPADEPWFLYLHFLDAHWPYDIPDAAARRFTSGDVDFFRGGDSRTLRDLINDGITTLTGEQQATLSALYDGALRFLDDELAGLFADLQRRGLADTLICVVADHGEEFLEHGRIGHGHGLWQNLLQVPWILHVPGQTPMVVSTPVSLVDLPPTLLAAAGLPAGDAGEGLDRLALPGRPAQLLAEHKAPDRYLQSLRVGPRKLLRTWVSPAETGADEDPDDVAVAAAAALLQPGTRWEAEVESRDGGLFATQLKPREEPPGDPLEVKGRIAAPDAAGFRLGGVAVRLDPGAAHSGDDAARAAGLREGALVKARGRMDGATLSCDKVKFYAEGEDDQLEVRGTVEAVEVRGDEARVRLQGLWVAFDEDTQWKNVALPPAATADQRFSREALAAALRLGGDAAARAGWSVRCELFDLAADPGEQQAVATWDGPLQPATHPDIRNLAEALDARVADLLGRSAWSSGDEAALNEAQLDDLRRIGYVR